MLTRTVPTPTTLGLFTCGICNRRQPDYDVIICSPPIMIRCRACTAAARGDQHAPARQSNAEAADHA
ncbi:Uncharacterised protein [Bordetella ansorpii]|uniref:Uncharacterized protein n=1 Tax=Bordetella ansorpii TaxID=288768 RepID=A0A157SVU6_9BORD|nr:hypothetical protein [Bordetella ansorpii]SAI74592.1 Uncharacterised protein [Bordetella ansorpii]